MVKYKNKLSAAAVFLVMCFYLGDERNMTA